MKIQRAHLKLRQRVLYQTQSGLYSCSWLPFGVLFIYAHGQIPAVIAISDTTGIPEFHNKKDV